MAKWDCEICRGRGVVRLARYKRVSDAPLDANVAISIDEMSSEYPCPECGIKANVERVGVLDAHSMVDEQVPKDAMPHIKAGVGHRLLDLLLDSGYVEFTEGKRDSSGRQFPVIATIYAVHPGEARRSIEDRLRERQDQMAKVVADEAIKRIGIWGSHYGNERISKSEVYDSIREALKRVSAAWGKESELRARGEIG